MQTYKELINLSKLNIQCIFGRLLLHNEPSNEPYIIATPFAQT